LEGPQQNSWSTSRNFLFERRREWQEFRHDAAGIALTLECRARGIWLVSKLAAATDSAGASLEPKTPSAKTRQMNGRQMNEMIDRRNSPLMVALQY
jgi:hypothetical protein